MPKKKKETKKRVMIKVYDTFRSSEEVKELKEDTIRLSKIAARYEIHYESCCSVTNVVVRCRKGSKVYKLCKLLGYKWG